MVNPSQVIWSSLCGFYFLMICSPTWLTLSTVWWHTCGCCLLVQVARACCSKQVSWLEYKMRYGTIAQQIGWLKDMRQWKRSRWDQVPAPLCSRWKLSTRKLGWCWIFFNLFLRWIWSLGLRSIKVKAPLWRWQSKLLQCRFFFAIPTTIVLTLLFVAGLERNQISISHWAKIFHGWRR